MKIIIERCDLCGRDINGQPYGAMSVLINEIGYYKKLMKITMQGVGGSQKLDICQECHDVVTDEFSAAIEASMKKISERKEQG